MFELNTRLQIASFIFLMVIALDFHKSQSIPTASNKYFRKMMILNAVNLLFDGITVYTVTHSDTFPFTLNVIFHRIFYITIAAIVQAYLDYVLCLGRKDQKKSRFKYFLHKLPFILAVICSLTLDIYFYNDNVKYAYSQGAAVSAVFVFVGIQIIICLFHTSRLRVSVQTRHMLFTGILLWTAVCLVQLLLPNWLLTGLGATMMVVLVYLSFETPSEYIDYSTNAFNRFAFDRVVDDMIYEKDSFYMIVMIIDDISTIISNHGYTKAHQMIKQINEELAVKKVKAFLSADNSLTVFAENKSQADITAELMLSFFSKSIDVDGISISPSGRVITLSYPETAANSDSISRILRYLVLHPAVKTASSEITEAQEREEKILYILKNAIVSNGFSVYYQPIFSTEKNRYTSAEALIRMTDYGEFDYISPEEYIPVAEQHGLILEIGKIVLREVCLFSSMNHLREKGIEYIEVNLSGLQIINPDLPGVLCEICSDYEIDPSFINLEITETAAVKSSEQMQKNITVLLKKGYTFSLDDFGTGYSNLSKISESDFQIIKLDKSLIWPCFDANKTDEERRRSRVILFSNISMIRQLGIHIVAEGAETKEMTDTLIEKGVDFIQGYYYSKPLCENDFMKTIS